MSDGPVFIGGLAFSGKTPLRVALSAHPRLMLTRRSALWSRHHGRYGHLGSPANLDRCLTALLADPGVARLKPDRARIERELRAGPATDARLFDLIHRHHAERHGKQRWGDQLGMLERHADLVLTAYPTAQMIHMIRDPRTRHAAAASAHRQLPGRLGWETARWRESADLAERNLSRYPGRYRVLRYESLCSAPETTLRAVTAFLGEAFDPAMLSALDAVTLDDHRRRVAFDAQREATVSGFIQRHVATQMLAHGYPLTAGVRDAGPRLPWSLVNRLCDSAGIALWHSVRAPQPAWKGVR
jgi:hypothetical protein